MKCFLTLLFMSFTLSAQTIDTLGITVNNGNTDLSTGYNIYTKIPGNSVTSSGTLLTIGINREEAASQEQRFALYTDVGDAPSALLDSTLEATASNGWIYIDVINGIDIVAGTTYWVGMKCNTTLQWYHNDNYAGHVIYDTQAYVSGWPDTVVDTDGSLGVALNAVIIISVPAVTDDDERGHKGYNNYLR